MTVATMFATFGVMMMLTYLVGMWLQSRVEFPVDDDFPPFQTPPLVVFVLPCLNEEAVIVQSLRRLKSVPLPAYEVLVIDDGSSDATAALVRSTNDPNVRLLRRERPEARSGKGSALNAGLAYLLTVDEVSSRSPHDVVLCILDADGELDTDRIDAVIDEFRDPLVGGVQIGVRISNRASRLIARLQDMEFVSYMNIFQVVRSRYGCAGLGGNGQFTRLSALLSVGEEPWSDSLTEDLDLGVRLFAAGWRTRFVPIAEVSQQGLFSVRALVRQRSRWFQGGLEAWRLIPTVTRRGGRMWVLAEVVHMLLSPALILATSLMFVSLAFFLAGVVTSGASQSPGQVIAFLLPVYLLTLFPGVIFGLTYARLGEASMTRALILAHAYVPYSFIWLISGWRAVARVVTRRTTWAKTDRLVSVSSSDGDLPSSPPPIKRG